MTASPEVANILEGRRELVDEWAKLDQEITIALAPLQGKIKRLSDLRELFLKWLPKDLPGEKEHFFDGEESRLLVSICDNRTEVTYAGKLKLKRLWGAKKLLETMTLACKLLPDPKDEAGLYTLKARTGPRHLKAIPRPNEAASQAA